MRKWWQFWKSDNAPSTPAAPSKLGKMARALALALSGAAPPKDYKYPIVPPSLFPGVLPAAVTTARVAMDSAVYDYARVAYGGDWAGFPGYPYLAQLATRAEYRAFADTMSTEVTREWIVLQSSETDDDATKDKITALTKALQDYNIQTLIRRAFEHDSYFGNGNIFINLQNQDKSVPLILDKRTIPKGSKLSFSTVEPMWLTPNAYNAIDPAAPDFYKPTSWFMLGKQIHATRLLRIVTREMPDMLKPAFNFSGISLSQLAEPYVDNWLRTRQSVSDIVANFSITALKTSMDQVLQGTDDGSDLIKRAQLFTAYRSNQGLMLLDKDREELVQVNTPLSGLSDLQSQAQEHMCSVSRTPATILTGISPKGFNTSSEGEIQTFNKWINALQEAFARPALEVILKVIQLVMYGEIDENITFSFEPLYQMTPKELAEIRTADATTAGVLIDRQVISPEEERERLARDPESGYEGLDMGVEITNANETDD